VTHVSGLREQGGRGRASHALQMHRDQWQGLPCWCWRWLLVQPGRRGWRWAGHGLDELVHARAPPGRRDVAEGRLPKCERRWLRSVGLAGSRVHWRVTGVQESVVEATGWAAGAGRCSVTSSWCATSKATLACNACMNKARRGRASGSTAAMIDGIRRRIASRAPAVPGGGCTSVPGGTSVSGGARTGHRTGRCETRPGGGPVVVDNLKYDIL
jgi:hypothetical protein